MIWGTDEKLVAIRVANPDSNISTVRNAHAFCMICVEINAVQIVSRREDLATQGAALVGATIPLRTY